jgi:hypothetical protein
VARSEASKAMNRAVILPENRIRLWPATATGTTRTEYSATTTEFPVGTGGYQRSGRICNEDSAAEILVRDTLQRERLFYISIGVSEKACESLVSTRGVRA